MKYLRIFLTSLQIQMQYRVNLFGWILVGFVPTITYIWIWLAILGNQEEIGGYTRNDFIFYYLLMTLLWYIVGGNYSGSVGDAIKEGDINKSLVKPYNVVLEKALLEQGWKCMGLLFVIPPIVFAAVHFHLELPMALSPLDSVIFILSLIAGGLIFALIEAIVGITSFWITETWSMAALADMSLDIFGGRMAPLTLMPLWLQKFTGFLPFKYIFSVPTEIIMGKSLNPLFDVFIQTLFILNLFLIYKLLWHFGIRRHEAVGG